MTKLQLLLQTVFARGCNLVRESLWAVGAEVAAAYNFLSKHKWLRAWREVGCYNGQ